MQKTLPGVRFLAVFASISMLFAPILSSAASAKKSAKPTAMEKRLDQATTFLRGTKIAKLNVEKTVVSELLGKTTSSEGVITFGQGKFRWDTTKPEKSLVVFDGKTLWTMQEPPKELGGSAQVTKSKVDGKARDQILVKLLSGGKFSSKFKVEEQGAAAEGDDVWLHLSPVKPDPNVKNFAVKLEGKPERLKFLRYTDEVGNQTTIHIRESETVKKPSADLFKFEPPKGAEVTEL